MAASKSDPASRWIDLVIARSADLRKAGVTSIGFDGCSACLLPEAPSYLPDDKSPAKDEPLLDVMHDPATYGGPAPGFEIFNLDGTRRSP